jgi:SAM-dependent methyltransferase
MKLHLGAGTAAKYHPDYINVDFLPAEGIDVVHNLNNYPWPFEDSSAEEIKCIDLIEHLPSHDLGGAPMVIKFVNECHRILKPSGKLFMTTPHHTSPNLWIDPSHTRGFDLRSFDYWDESTDLGRDYGYYTPCKYKVSAVLTDNLNCEFTLEKR